VPQMRIWAASVQATFERTFFNPGYLGSTRVEEMRILSSSATYTVVFYSVPESIDISSDSISIMFLLVTNLGQGIFGNVSHVNGDLASNRLCPLIPLNEAPESDEKMRRDAFLCSYSRSPKNSTLQLLQNTFKSASTIPQRPIWNTFGTVAVRVFWEKGCRPHW